VCSADGEPQEIHVLADRSRSPKQLSRDIQSAISAASGIIIDHNIISIAQIDSGDVEKNQPRLRIAGLDISYSRERFDVSVTLDAGGETFSGSISGASGAGRRLADAAGACIDAVNKYMGREIFRLYDIQKVRMGELNSVTVAVSCCEGHEEKMLAGSSIIRDDEYFAAVRGTLSAVNRVLPLFSHRQ
jgi:hypothetical protein